VEYRKVAEKSLIVKLRHRARLDK